MRDTDPPTMRATNRQDEGSALLAMNLELHADKWPGIDWTGDQIQEKQLAVKLQNYTMGFAVASCT